MEGSCPCCSPPAMADSAESCAHCGKQGVGFKRCSRCKHASYCGAECQNADWKRHKKKCAPPPPKCAPPVPLQEVGAKINAARATDDWRGILKWEGRMEELVAHRSDDVCSEILKAFSTAHHMGLQATRSADHARSFVTLEERRVPLLGKLQRFRDQGNRRSTICTGHSGRWATTVRRGSQAAAAESFALRFRVKMPPTKTGIPPF